MTLKKDSIPSAKSGRNMKLLGISIPVLTVSVFLFSFGVFNTVDKDTNYKNEVAHSSVESMNYATGNYSILGMMDTVNPTNLTQNTKEVAIAIGNEKQVKQIMVAEGVQDTTAPVITLKQQEVKIKAGESLNLNQNIAGVTDNLEGNAAKYTVTGNVNKNVAGNYTVTVKATDSNNNISTTSYKVKVEANPNVQTQSNTNTTANEATTNAPSTVDTSSVISVAKSLVGSKYRSGGTTPAGFDCSGFVWYAYKQVGKNISRSSAGQLSSGVAVSESNLQPGDIILWANNGSNRVSHSSLYIGGGQIIHATTNKGVRYSPVSTWKTWGQHIVGIRRV